MYSTVTFTFFLKYKVARIRNKTAISRQNVMTNKRAKSVLGYSVPVCLSLHNQGEIVIVFLIKPHLKSRCGTFLLSNNKLNF